MLDRRTSKLLKYLTSFCQQDSYKVVDSTTLIAKISAKVNVSQLEKMLQTLSKNEYIDIKYNENNEYCLTVTNKGRTYFETLKETKKYTRIHITNFVISAISGGVMGFVAYLIGKAIMG